MSPFKSIDHTADIAYFISGRSLEELFSHAAAAWLNSVAEIREIYSFELIELNFAEESYESLLVDFLSELNYLLTVKKILCYEIVKVNIGENGDNEKVLTVVLKMMQINEKNCILKNDVKAVTYHQLEIINKDNEFSTTIVFDT